MTLTHRVNTVFALLCIYVCYTYTIFTERGGGTVAWYYGFIVHGEDSEDDGGRDYDRMIEGERSDGGHGANRRSPFYSDFSSRAIEMQIEKEIIDLRRELYTINSADGHSAAKHVSVNTSLLPISSPSSRFANKYVAYASAQRAATRRVGRLLADFGFDGDDRSVSPHLLQFYKSVRATRPSSQEDFVSKTMQALVVKVRREEGEADEDESGILVDSVSDGVVDKKLSNSKNGKQRKRTGGNSNPFSGSPRSSLLSIELSGQALDDTVALHEEKYLPYIISSILGAGGGSVSLSRFASDYFRFALLLLPREVIQRLVVRPFLFVFGLRNNINHHRHHGNATAVPTRQDSSSSSPFESSYHYSANAIPPLLKDHKELDVRREFVLRAMASVIRLRLVDPLGKRGGDGGGDGDLITRGGHSFGGFELATRTVLHALSSAPKSKPSAATSSSSSSSSREMSPFDSLVEEAKNFLFSSSAFQNQTALLNLPAHHSLPLVLFGKTSMVSSSLLTDLRLLSIASTALVTGPAAYFTSALEEKRKEEAPLPSPSPFSFSSGYFLAPADLGEPLLPVGDNGLPKHSIDVTVMSTSMREKTDEQTGDSSFTTHRRELPPPAPSAVEAAKLADGTMVKLVIIQKGKGGGVGGGGKRFESIAAEGTLLAKPSNTSSSLSSSSSPSSLASLDPARWYKQIANAYKAQRLLANTVVNPRRNSFLSQRFRSHLTVLPPPASKFSKAAAAQQQQQSAAASSLEEGEEGEGGGVANSEEEKGQQKSKRRSAAKPNAAAAASEQQQRAPEEQRRKWNTKVVIPPSYYETQTGLGEVNPSVLHLLCSPSSATTTPATAHSKANRRDEGSSSNHVRSGGSAIKTNDVLIDAWLSPEPHFGAGIVVSLAYNMDSDAHHANDAVSGNKKDDGNDRFSRFTPKERRRIKAHVLDSIFFSEGDAGLHVVPTTQYGDDVADTMLTGVSLPAVELRRMRPAAAMRLMGAQLTAEDGGRGDVKGESGDASPSSSHQSYTLLDAAIAAFPASDGILFAGSTSSSAVNSGGDLLYGPLLAAREASVYAFMNNNNNAEEGGAGGEGGGERGDHRHHHHRSVASLQAPYLFAHISLLGQRPHRPLITALWEADEKEREEEREATLEEEKGAGSSGGASSSSSPSSSSTAAVVGVRSVNRLVQKLRELEAESSGEGGGGGATYNPYTTSQHFISERERMIKYEYVAAVVIEDGEDGGGGGRHEVGGGKGRDKSANTARTPHRTTRIIAHSKAVKVSVETLTSDLLRSAMYAAATLTEAEAQAILSRPFKETMAAATEEEKEAEEERRRNSSAIPPSVESRVGAHYADFIESLLHAVSALQHDSTSASAADGYSQARKAKRLAEMLLPSPLSPSSSPLSSPSSLHDGVYTLLQAAMPALLPSRDMLAVAFATLAEGSEGGNATARRRHEKALLDVLTMRGGESHLHYLARADNGNGDGVYRTLRSMVVDDALGTTRHHDDDNGALIATHPIAFGLLFAGPTHSVAAEGNGKSGKEVLTEPSAATASDVTRSYYEHLASSEASISSITHFFVNPHNSLSTAEKKSKRNTKSAPNAAAGTTDSISRRRRCATKGSHLTAFSVSLVDFIRAIARSSIIAGAKGTSPLNTHAISRIVEVQLAFAVRGNTKSSSSSLSLSAFVSLPPLIATRIASQERKEVPLLLAMLTTKRGGGDLPLRSAADQPSSSQSLGSMLSPMAFLTTSVLVVPVGNQSVGLQSPAQATVVPPAAAAMAALEVLLQTPAAVAVGEEEKVNTKRPPPLNNGGNTAVSILTSDSCHAIIENLRKEELLPLSVVIDGFGQHRVASGGDVGGDVADRNDDDVAFSHKAAAIMDTSLCVSQWMWNETKNTSTTTTAASIAKPSSSFAKENLSSLASSSSSHNLIVTVPLRLSISRSLFLSSKKEEKERVDEEEDEEVAQHSSSSIRLNPRRVRDALKQACVADGKRSSGLGSFIASHILRGKTSHKDEETNKARDSSEKDHSNAQQKERLNDLLFKVLDPKKRMNNGENDDGNRRERYHGDEEEDPADIERRAAAEWLKVVEDNRRAEAQYHRSKKQHQRSQRAAPSDVRDNGDKDSHQKKSDLHSANEYTSRAGLVLDTALIIPSSSPPLSTNAHHPSQEERGTTTDTTATMRHLANAMSRRFTRYYMYFLPQSGEGEDPHNADTSPFTSTEFATLVDNVCDQFADFNVPRQTREALFHQTHANENQERTNGVLGLLEDYFQEKYNYLLSPTTQSNMGNNEKGPSLANHADDSLVLDLPVWVWMHHHRHHNDDNHHHGRAENSEEKSVVISSSSLSSFAISTPPISTSLDSILLTHHFTLQKRFSQAIRSIRSAQMAVADAFATLRRRLEAEEALLLWRVEGARGAVMRAARRQIVDTVVSSHHLGPSAAAAAIGGGAIVVKESGGVDGAEEAAPSSPPPSPSSSISSLVEAAIRSHIAALLEAAGLLRDIAVGGVGGGGGTANARSNDRKEGWAATKEGDHEVGFAVSGDGAPSSSSSSSISFSSVVFALMVFFTASALLYGVSKNFVRKGGRAHHTKGVDGAGKGERDTLTAVRSQSQIVSDQMMSSSVVHRGR